MVLAEEKTKTRKLPEGTVVGKIRPIITETIERLRGTTDELQIKEIVTKAMLGIEITSNSEGSAGTHRTELRDEIEDAYPSIEISTESPDTQPAGYYFTKAGKGKVSRYEHLGLWYATTNKSRWNVVGDAEREKYFKNLKPFKTTEQPTEQPAEQPAEQPTEQTTEQHTEQPVKQPAEQLAAQQTFTFETMTLEQLQLPSDIEATVNAALTNSGLSLPEFLKQAAKVYANTLVGRSSQASDDLSRILTDILKTDKKFNTHPARPAELVKRAIKAIKLHNGNCTTLKEKWNITQSLLVELTGSRPGMVKDLVNGQFSTVIADYNAATFSELNESELRCWNRKGDSISKPDLVVLVPDGMDI